MRFFLFIFYKILFFFKMLNVIELINFKNVFCIVLMVFLMFLNIIDIICFKISLLCKVYVMGFG